MQKIQICKEWLKPKLAGRKKYVLACVIALIAIFVLILISQKPANQSRQKETSISSTNTTITIPAQLVLEINEPENEEIVIIDSEKLDVELIDKKLNPRAEEVAKHAEASQVEVYSNSEGILKAPTIRETKEISDDSKIVPLDVPVIEPNIISDEKPVQHEDNLSQIEATYEEELPEGEYVEVSDTILSDNVTTQKLKGMEISIDRKPPYFGENPVIAVVIDDMGISHKRTSDISSLHAPITSSFLTYSKNLNAQINNARQAGHEIIIHVPMQAKSNLDVAPDILTIEMSAAQIAVSFEAMLDKFSNVHGVNNHMGSLFTEHAEKLAPVMDILRRRGLFFLDSKTSSKSVAKNVATDYAVAYAHRHVFLDNNNNKDYVLNQLALTEKIANRNGNAIAIGHPKSATFEALKEWIPTLEQKNIQLVHLSKIVKALNPHIELSNQLNNGSQESFDTVQNH